MQVSVPVRRDLEFHLSSCLFPVTDEDGIPTEEKMEEYMKKLNPSVTAQIIREAQASGKEIDYDALF